MNKEESIRIRIAKKEKDFWQKFISKSKEFPSISQLIRYLVNSYIDGDLIERAKNNKTREEHEKIEKIQKLYEKQEEMLSLKMNQMEKLLTSKPGHRNEKIKDFENLKGQTITLLERTSATSEVIAKILNKKEPEILEILSELKKANLINFNKNMEYYLTGD